MKCRNHPYELGAGVCASCLRERLLALIADQDGRSPEHLRNLDPPPPAFPRSVSPNVFRRRSVGSGPSPSSSYFHRPHCRFFSTPQVGPTSTTTRADGDGIGASAKKRGFSLFSALFGRSRSDEIAPSKSSGSWISDFIFAGRRKKKSQSRSKSFQERGISPVKDGDDSDSGCSSGYSIESPTGWRRPEPTPISRFTSSTGRHIWGVSGFAVCLSPLVRPSPKAQADVGISGDLRGSLSVNHRRHVSVGAASLVPSRSRKLADCGRFR